MTTTYIGIVCEGRVEFETPVALPEGSQVVVLPVKLDERIARRKANSWLAENVGNVVGKRPSLSHSTGDGYRFDRIQQRLTGETIDPSQRNQRLSVASAILITELREPLSQNFFKFGQRLNLQSHFIKLFECIQIESFKLFIELPQCNLKTRS